MFPWTVGIKKIYTCSVTDYIKQDKNDEKNSYPETAATISQLLSPEMTVTAFLEEGKATEMDSKLWARNAPLTQAQLPGSASFSSFYPII